MKNYERYCSFCGRYESEVEKMAIGSNEASICNLCVDAAYNEFHTEIIEDLVNDFKFQDFTPKKIKKIMDEYVIGQDEAKKVLSIAVYNHYKRLLDNELNYDGEDDVVLNKNNVILVGPTGVGKTMLAKTLARILKVPFAIADATSLTEAGYVGDDVETVITRLIDDANGDIRLAQKGIIYIDEIDKISKRSNGRSITRDVSGEGVQQALLKLIEGTEASVPLSLGRKNPNQEMVKVDTSNILFIIGGAFPDIDTIVKKRFNKKDIGFDLNSEVKTLSEKEVYENITSDDLIEYGLIPEFMGRISNIAPLVPLTETDLLHILTEPKNAIVKQYEKLFAMDDVKIKFDKSALEAMAKITLEKNVGARGLSSILEKTMNDLMFEVPGDKTIESITINKDVVENKKDPIIKRKKTKTTKKKASV